MCEDDARWVACRSQDVGSDGTGDGLRSGCKSGGDKKKVIRIRSRRQYVEGAQVNDRS